MSRKVSRRVLLFSLALLLPAFCKYRDLLAGATPTPDDCSKLDIAELEDYLSNLENATIDTTILEPECPATALPFGALKSDWARLLLLKRAQPQNSILQEKLDRLFRILAIAYSETDGHFDIAKFVCRAASSAAASSAYESDNSEKKAEELEPTTGSRKMHEIPESSVSTVAFGIEESTDATEIERAAFTSPYVTGEESKREASVRMHNDGSSTVPSSPVGNSTSERIDAEERRIVESFVTAPTNVTGETLDDYLDNKKSNGGPLSANFVTSDFIEDRNISGTILLGDVHTTTAMLDNDLQETQGTGDSFENTVDSLGRDKGITSNFMVKKSSIKGITEDFVKYIYNTEYFTSGSTSASDVSHTTSVDRQKEDQRSTVNGDDTGPSLSEFAKLSSPEMSNDKSTTERSRVYMDGISGNDAVGSIKSFPREPSNRREHGIFKVFQKTPNSTDHRIKIRKSSISRKPPADNGFWKYIVIPRNVTSSDRTGETNELGGGPGKSKKRGSTNANAQKIFRWFYNVGQVDENERSSERHGIRIECSEDRLEDVAAPRL